MVSFTFLPLYLKERTLYTLDIRLVELHNQSVRHGEFKSLDRIGLE
jgi:hypothetical protein